MSESFELVVRSVMIGVGATMAMDAWAALLARFGVPSLRLAVLGRWLGHLPRGRWIHDDIARAAPVRGERWIGACAHYGIGVAFAGVLVGVFGLDWARSPTLAPALLVGIVTVVAPLFILQPGLGAGIASTKTPAPVARSLKSLVTHTVFGLGMFLAARATALLLPAA